MVDAIDIVVVVVVIVEVVVVVLAISGSRYEEDLGIIGMTFLFFLSQTFCILDDVHFR